MLGVSNSIPQDFNPTGVTEEPAVDGSECGRGLHRRLSLRQSEPCPPAEEPQETFESGGKAPLVRKGGGWEKLKVTHTLWDKMDLSYQNLSLKEYLSFYFSLISTFYFMNAII